jgi:hypothetical protein
VEIMAGSGRQLLGLFVVFSLLGVTVWKLGRFRGVGSPGRWRESFLKMAFSGKNLAAKTLSGERPLERVERLALTPQHTLHVLRLHDREILVATHPQGCTLLDSPPAPAARGMGA